MFSNVALMENIFHQSFLDISKIQIYVLVYLASEHFMRKYLNVYMPKLLKYHN